MPVMDMISGQKKPEPGVLPDPRVKIRGLSSSGIPAPSSSQVILSIGPDSSAKNGMVVIPQGTVYQILSVDEKPVLVLVALRMPN
jgi:hypothetical protein